MAAGGAEPPPVGPAPAAPHRRRRRVPRRWPSPHSSLLARGWRLSPTMAVARAQHVGLVPGFPSFLSLLHRRGLRQGVQGRRPLEETNPLRRRAPQWWTAARPSAPEGAFPFWPWWRQAPPLPMFFDRCLGMPMRVGSRGTARPWLRRRTFPASPRPKTGEISFGFSVGISGWLGFPFP
jgi:hypothetical protein